MNNIAKPYLRVLSGLINLLVFLLPLIYSIYWFSLVTNFESILNRFFSLSVFFLIYQLLISLINSFLISTFGGTIGNLLTGTKIVLLDQQNISFWRAFLRNHIGYIISSMFLWLGFIWIFIDKEKRAWHDMIADTYVILVNKSLLIVGIIVLIILSWLNVSLFSQSFKNFSQNSNVYYEIFYGN